MAALTSFISMPTCLVTPPCFKLALPGLVPKYSLQTSSPKVPSKWLSWVESKFSYHRSLGGDHRALKGGYGAFNGGPKVPNKWVSRVECKFSYKRSLGGHHRALGVGHDAGGEDKGDVYLKHRDKTFVVAIGSRIAIIPTLLEALLKEISVLRRFGLKFVLIPGLDEVINARMIQRGINLKRRAGQVSTMDDDCLKVTMQEAGKLSLEIQANLSYSDDFPLGVPTGNHVFALKMEDYGATGKVILVDGVAVRNHLKAHDIVLVSQFGFSPKKEVLYCDLYDVASSCAMAVAAKQLIYVLDGPFPDDHLDRIPFHKSMPLFMGGVGVKTIDGTVELEGAMLKFFQTD